MTIKTLCGVCAGFVFGAAAMHTLPSAVAQEAQDKPQSISEFPNLVQGLLQTPGCIGVKTGSLGPEQRVIYAWFKNRAAVNAWYKSPMHSGAMKQFFPNLPGKAEAIPAFKDENAPLLVVASVTPSDKPSVEGSRLAISQIAIEIYTPVPGGIVFGSGFAPDTLEVPHMRRITQ